MKIKLKSQLFDSDFLKKLEQMVITSKITLADGASGNRKSRAKGSSVEFSDYREYSIGDDFKRIDWNAYGRFEKLFIKLFMEEREAPIHIFLDNSKSMDWGEPNKSIVSRRLAAALSYISLSSYDRVSLVCMNNAVDKYKPDLRGKNSFSQILNLMESLEYTGTTDIYNTISKFNLKNGKGISIVISDLFTQGNLLDMINYLQYKKQEIYICHILAPQEVEPEIGMSLRLIDVETSEFRDVTASPDLIKSYKKVYKKFITNIEEKCKSRGVNYIFMESSVPIEKMVGMVVNRV